MIVVGVLVALAADAWWDRRGERVAERDLIEALESELRFNLEEIDRVSATTAGTLGAAEAIHAMTGPSASLPQDEDITSTLLQAMIFETLDPSTGAIDQILTTGSLRLIRSAALRSEFPAPRDASKSIRRETAAKWLLKAERDAKLPKITGGVFHPFRRLFASERRHLPDVDVAWAGGWSDPETMKKSYQQADAPGVLRAVLNAGA